MVTPPAGFDVQQRDGEVRISFNEARGRYRIPLTVAGGVGVPALLVGGLYAVVDKGAAGLLFAVMATGIAATLAYACFHWTVLTLGPEGLRVQVGLLGFSREKRRLPWGEVDALAAVKRRDDKGNTSLALCAYSARTRVHTVLFRIDTPEEGEFLRAAFARARAAHTRG